MSPQLQAFAHAGSFEWPACLLHVFSKPYPATGTSHTHTHHYPYYPYTRTVGNLPHLCFHHHTTTLFCISSNWLAFEVYVALQSWQWLSRDQSIRLTPWHLGHQLSAQFWKRSVIVGFLVLKGKLLTPAPEKQGISLTCPNSFLVTLGGPENLGCHLKHTVRGAECPPQVLQGSSGWGRLQQCLWFLGLCNVLIQSGWAPACYQMWPQLLAGGG